MPPFVDSMMWFWVSATLVSIPSFRITTIGLKLLADDRNSQNETEHMGTREQCEITSYFQ